jgi:hypothetical protein
MYLKYPVTNSFYQRTECSTAEAWLCVLDCTAHELLEAGVQPSQLRERMTNQIAATVRATRRSVVLSSGKTDGRWFQFGGYHGAEYARVTVTIPKAVRLVSSKIAGVVMSANFSKPGAYDHDNAHVADALRTLADIIEKAPVRLADNDIELSVGR